MDKRSLNRESFLGSTSLLWSSKRVVVTGGAGFLGSYAVGKTNGQFDD